MLVKNVTDAVRTYMRIQMSIHNFWLTERGSNPLIKESIKTKTGSKNTKSLQK